MDTATQVAPTAATHAQGLRDLADWLEANADILTGSDLGSPIKLYFCRIDRDEFVEAAQRLGGGDYEVKGKYLQVRRPFGPIEVHLYIDADKVGRSKTRLRETVEYEIDPEILAALEPHDRRDDLQERADAIYKGDRAEEINQHTAAD